MRTNFIMSITKKIMKQLFLFCSITLQLLVLTTSVNSQRLSLIGSVGASNYRGDLSTNYTPPFGVAFGFGATYDIDARWRLRCNFNNLNVQADDVLSPNAGLSDRALNFKTNISEFALLGEYDLLDYEYNRIIPYIFGGAAVYHFDPHPLHPITQYGDVNLHSLGTEGQLISGLPGVKGNYSDNVYNLTQLNVQLGAGVRYEINDDISLGLEVNLRKLFTDYLDDVSGPHYVPPSDWKAAKNYYTSLGLKGKADLDKTVEAEAYAFRGVIGLSKFSEANANSFPRGNPNKNDAFYSVQLRLNIRINSIGGPDFTLFSTEHTNGRKQLKCAGNVY